MFKIRQGTLKRPLAGRASVAQTILQLMMSLLMSQYWSDKISQNRAKKLCEGEHPKFLYELSPIEESILQVIVPVTPRRESSFS